MLRFLLCGMFNVCWVYASAIAIGSIAPVTDVLMFMSIFLHFVFQSKAH